MLRYGAVLCGTPGGVLCALAKTTLHFAPCIPDRIEGMTSHITLSGNTSVANRDLAATILRHNQLAPRHAYLADQLWVAVKTTRWNQVPCSFCCRIILCEHVATALLAASIEQRWYMHEFLRAPCHLGCSKGIKTACV
jgi:hypothetical protein